MREAKPSHESSRCSRTPLLTGRSFTSISIPWYCGTFRPPLAKRTGQHCPRSTDNQMPTIVPTSDAKATAKVISTHECVRWMAFQPASVNRYSGLLPENSCPCGREPSGESLPHGTASEIGSIQPRMWQVLRAGAVFSSSSMALSMTHTFPGWSSIATRWRATRFSVLRMNHSRLM